MPSHNQAPRLGERLLNHKATRWLGRLMVGEAPMSEEYRQAAMGLTSPNVGDAQMQAYWGQIGGQGAWDVDPYDQGRVTLAQAAAPARAHTAPVAQRREQAPQAKPSPVQAYKVQGEGGIPRFESRAEQANRMAAFNLRYPDANAHERSFYEYSGQLPPGSSLQPSGLYANGVPEDLSALSGHKMIGPMPAPAIGATRPPEHMLAAAHVSEFPAAPAELVHGAAVPVTPDFVPLEVAHPGAIPVPGPHQ